MRVAPIRGKSSHHENTPRLQPIDQGPPIPFAEEGHSAERGNDSAIQKDHRKRILRLRQGIEGLTDLKAHAIPSLPGRKMSPGHIDQLSASFHNLDSGFGKPPGEHTNQGSTPAPQVQQ